MCAISKSRQRASREVLSDMTGSNIVGWDILEFI